MKILKALSLLLVSMSALSEQVSVFGKTYESKLEKTVFACDGFNIDVIEDRLGVDFEMDISPSSAPDFIPGFMGMHSILSKKAILTESGWSIPNANDIEQLNGKLKSGRTYIVSSVTCKKDRVVVYYYSGGNCNGCEAFVEFNYKNGKLINPTTSSYKAYKSLKK